MTETAADAAIWPTELRLSKDKRSLTVSFDDGSMHIVSAELLRVMSPSAEVRGHAPSERKTVGGKRTVSIRTIEPIGNYAIRIDFNDGHATGIYTWPFLHDLGVHQASHQAQYESDLEAKGLDRDRPGQR